MNLGELSLAFKAVAELEQLSQTISGIETALERDDSIAEIRSLGIPVYSVPANREQSKSVQALALQIAKKQKAATVQFLKGLGVEVEP